MKLGLTRIDTDAVKAGVWTTFIIKRTGDTIKLRMALANSTTNLEYQKALRAAMSEHDRALSVYTRGSEMPARLVKEITEIGRKVFAETIVTDWAGVDGEDGKPLPFSPEGCLALFDEFPELLTDAEDEAKKVERYRVQVLEKQAGNSATA